MSRFSFLLPALAVLFLTSCLLDSDRGSTGRVWDGSPGFAQLNIGLDRNEHHGLAKRSASDTTFGLDSLIVVLTATGADTIRFSQAISGRPDTGVIAIDPMVFTLNPLLNWKARFYSIDTTVSPMKRDTVHIDSIIFAVRPADTAFVNKTVSAAFSILRARFRSDRDSLVGVSIRYLRVKVGGVTRDSTELYGGTYNGVWFATRQIGWAVQDSGRLHRSDDSGKSWFPRTTGTTRNLRSVSFVNTTEGWIAGDGGLIKTSTDGGTSWSDQDSRTDYNINTIQFPTPDTGYAVTDSGLVLRTANGGANWKVVSGGWFKSLNTSATLRDVGFNGYGATSWAVGQGGIIQQSNNFGGAWTYYGTTNQTLNALRFYSATNGYAVGDSGRVLRFASGNWVGQPAVTGTPLQSVFVRSADSAWAVGDSERVVRNTANGGGAWAVVPSGWQTQTSNPAKSWYGIAFGTSTTGWIVGADSSIRVTTNRGASWAQVPFNAPRGNRHLRAVAAFNANIAIAVGDSGYAARIRTGTNWNWYATGAGTAVHYRGVAFHPTLGRRAWAVSPNSNTIRSTDDTGRTWTSRNPTTSGTWNAVSASNTYIYVVGNGGIVRRSSNLNSNANFNTAVSNGLLGTTNLYGASFRTTNADTGWVVGAGGTVYRTHNADAAAASVPWTRMATPDSSTDLIGVRFINGTTGWVTGVNGKIWRTTDRGTTWLVQHHDGTDSLRSVWSNHTDTAYLVGSNGVIRATTTAGNFVSGKSTPQKLNGVFFPSNLIGYVVGSNGTISKTTNAGLRWTAQTNSDPDSLNGVHFIHADTGWAVGNTGTILKTVNGGTSWVPQTSPNSENLRRVRFHTGQRGWAVGDNGTIIYTTNGGTSWTAQTSGTNSHLYGLEVEQDTVYAVGAGGVIRKTLNGGVPLVIIKDLKGMHARSKDSIYVVGKDGTAYRSRNGAGSFEQLTGATENFNAVFSTGNNAYLVGDGGKMYTIQQTTGSTALTPRTTNITQNLRAAWGSPTVSSSVVLIAGDSGIIGRITAVGTPPALDTFSYRENLRAIHCVRTTDTDCWILGSRETSMRNTTPLSLPWSLMGMGAKRFDVTLSSKYLRPGVVDTVVIQAIDRLSPLRGYEKRIEINIGAGIDSTINSGLTKCGYDLTPACHP